MSETHPLFIVVGVAIVLVACPVAIFHNAARLKMSRREVVATRRRTVLVATCIYVFLGAVFICAGLGLLR